MNESLQPPADAATHKREEVVGSSPLNDSSTSGDSKSACSLCVQYDGVNFPRGRPRHTTRTSTPASSAARVNLAIVSSVGRRSPRA